MRIRYLIWFLVFFTNGGSAFSQVLEQKQESWEFLYSEDNLKVYVGDRRERPTFKAEGVVQANLFELLAVVADIPRRGEWLTEIIESRIVEGEIDSRVIIYEKFRMPWMFLDRDSVVESLILSDYQKKEVTVNYHNVVHPSEPVRKGLVRVPFVKGLMFFKWIDVSHSFAKFETSLDSGIGLPAWMVNSVVKNVPLKTLVGLTKQVAKTKGQYDAFIKNHQSGR